MWNLYGEKCFCQKTIKNGLNKGFSHNESELKRQSMLRKHTDFFGKKKFRAQQSVKKVMLTVFWDMKGPITIDFLEKGATVNNASYCQLLKQRLPYLFSPAKMGLGIFQLNLC